MLGMNVRLQPETRAAPLFIRKKSNNVPVQPTNEAKLHQNSKKIRSWLCPDEAFNSHTNCVFIQYAKAGPNSSFWAGLESEYADLKINIRIPPS